MKKELIKNESDFLAFKVDASKEALRRNVEEMVKKLSEGLNLKKWTEKYPFEATGAAAVIGFFVAEGFNVKPSEAPKTQPQVQSPPTFNSSPLSLLLFSTAADLLKESLTPLIKKHLSESHEEFHDERRTS